MIQPAGGICSLVGQRVVHYAPGDCLILALNLPTFAFVCTLKKPRKNVNFGFDLLTLLSVIIILVLPVWQRYKTIHLYEPGHSYWFRLHRNIIHIEKKEAYLRIKIVT